MISIDIDQASKQVLISVAGITARHNSALKRSLHEIGADVVKETRRFIKSPPKTGRHWPGLPNRSSAPGESPATQSGRLARSGDYSVRNDHEMTVGETAPYAKYLEDGTRKMQPRPHLIRAVKSTARQAIRTIKDNLTKV